LQLPNIQFFNTGIEYDDIPKLLTQYDVGLVLYKAITLNFKYNATNKFFEYLACDLDVWFPKQMEGCYPYITKDTYPKVVKIDFENLDKIDFHELIFKENLRYSRTDYFAEDAFAELINRLSQTD
jgi:hypothetical protein